MVFCNCVKSNTETEYNNINSLQIGSHLAKDEIISIISTKKECKT